MTYVGERDPSFSANCNVLMAFLHIYDVQEYIPYIISITTFLCDTWREGLIRDKWVCHPNMPVSNWSSQNIESLASILDDAFCKCVGMFALALRQRLCGTITR